MTARPLCPANGEMRTPDCPECRQPLARKGHTLHCLTPQCIVHVGGPFIQSAEIIQFKLVERPCDSEEPA